ncbi:MULTISPECIES: very short patch repair endonuclease [unclassified Aeromonas]|uniref:very short patch repair endonuclease n=1 Tax=Aeromonas TaxID=642 RepID=UPI001C21893F|nr:very short patch repair endonuclease [Aeromonas sp. FDAARGOS 1407]QXC33477.1 very short patch repair endonuclease [Aeromonas sp. FDAARGOS 1407]
MDVVDTKTRSAMMSGIRSKNTRPEILLRKYLHARGFRFRLHVKDLPGKPDIVLPRYRLCIFVHGCFWHRHPGCSFAATPKSNTKFWLQKFAANTTRDAKVDALLYEAGWRVFKIWECGLKQTNDNALGWLPVAIRGKTRYLNWPDTNVGQL